mgnify:CR=1 FL=1
MLPLALALSLGVSMLPIFRVIESGQWAVGAAVGILVILGIGWIARSFHLTAVLVFLTETLAAVAYITAVFARESSFAFVIPTGASLRDAIESVQRAMDAIVTGAAPLPAGGDLSFLLVTAAVNYQYQRDFPREWSDSWRIRAGNPDFTDGTPRG